jgi:hypothetical protein
MKKAVLSIALFTFLELSQAQQQSGSEVASHV